MGNCIYLQIYIGACTCARCFRSNYMRFIGDYSAKADAKGRVFLPVAFRKVMDAENEQRFILRTDLFQKCLVLYPETLWNSMLDTLRERLNRWNGEHQHIMRRFVAEAEVVELDNNGRFLISKRKLAYAGIKQNVRFLAIDDHIEVWDMETCENLLTSDYRLSDELQSVMADIFCQN